MATDKPVEIFRKDYKPPSYLTDTVHLTFVVNEDVTRVESRLQIKPNYKGDRPELFLNGACSHRPVCSGFWRAGTCCSLRCSLRTHQAESQPLFSVPIMIVCRS